MDGTMILKVKKRDGREKPFNIEKIAGAIAKALRASGELNERLREEEQQLSLIKINPEEIVDSTALKR
jgi:transcriptional regulator NrdR family protein